MGLVASVRHNLANLTNFAGRESRAQFWPYAVVVFVLAMAVYMGLVAPAIIETQRQFALIMNTPVGHSVTLHGELMPIGPWIIASLVTFVLLVLSLATALVRRLHDSGRPGLWVALPMLFFAISSAIIFPMMSTRHEPPLEMIFPAFFSVVAYFAALARLFLWLVRAGGSGENKYGPQP